MLKNIHPSINPPLLAALGEMGHGDEIVIVDANFPLYSVARRAIDIPAISATDMLEAILSLLPLDSFVEMPATVMTPVDPKDASAIFDEFQNACDRAEGKHVEIESIDRFAFYERARKAYAIVQTGERRLYGNIILKKGVVR